MGYGLFRLFILDFGLRGSGGALDSVWAIASLAFDLFGLPGLELDLMGMCWAGLIVGLSRWRYKQSDVLDCVVFFGMDLFHVVGRLGVSSLLGGSLWWDVCSPFSWKFSIFM